ncbi:MAG: metallophosphoesterase [Acidobacteria bacterium]|nr:metallophosphoesterase [Acidobacteriota bacterium]
MIFRLFCGLVLVATLAPSHPASVSAEGTAQAIELVRHPYLQQVTSTSAVVVWATIDAGPAEVRYRVGSGTQTTVWATSTFFSASTTGLTDGFYQHEATLQGLKASTTYTYEVRVGGMTVTGGSGSLSTAPPAGTGTTRFIAFGDSGTGSTEQRSLATLMRADTFDLSLHTGDVVYGNAGGTSDGSRHTLNAWFFGIYRDWLRSKPMFPSLGNHDSRQSTSHGAAYLSAFVLPTNGASASYPDHAERYYSFDYGPVHFVALDTERALQEPARRSEQLAWLAADLASTTQPWKVVYFHRSPYSAGLHHGSDLAVRQAFAPLFEQHGVHLVLSAHDHLYERSLPWRETLPGHRGVTYIVTGGGGAPVYPAGMAEWTAFSASTHHYVRAAADACTLSIEAVGLSGKVFDSGRLSLCEPLDVSPPSVALVAPAAGAQVSGTATVSVEASDDVAVSKVGLYVDGVLVSTMLNTPYTYTWNTATVNDGDHTIEARAYDTAGNRASSGARTVRVSNSLPSPWETRDVGAVGLVGRAGASDGTFTVAGAGDDIWNAADAFRFVHRPLSGDGQIIARVRTVDNVHPWTKAGVMMRETVGAGSRHVSMFVTPEKVLAFQRRTSTGGPSAHTPGSSATAPSFVKLVRSGNTFTASVSTNGTAWTVVGSETISMAGTIAVGLAVTSHDTRALATATFDNVAVTTGGDAPVGLPSPWTNGDIGRVGAAGAARAAGGTITVEGAGADVWGTADAFHYVYQPLTGNGEIVARVGSVQNVDQWTKAGVMMRETLSAGSRHAFMLVSPGKGLAFQRRTSTNGTSIHTTGGTGTAPAWVKLVRAGNTFSAYKSANGTSWTLVDSSTISMGTTILVGLAVSSHKEGVLASAAFDAIRVEAAAAALAWASQDIGAVGQSGSTVESAGTFTVKGSGSDVWGTADGFHYTYRQLAGDGEIVARAATIENTDQWAKAGVMMRETLGAGSRHAFALVSPSKGLAFQRRLTTGGESVHTSGGAGTAPRWVRLVRSGSTTFSAYVSSNGTSWTLVGSETISMGSTIHVGLAVTSHNNSRVCAATFDQVTVSGS